MIIKGTPTAEDLSTHSEWHPIDEMLYFEVCTSSVDFIVTLAMSMTIAMITKVVVIAPIGMTRAFFMVRGRATHPCRRPSGQCWPK